ncbi:BrnA antitoxin family protein [bacterium]|nr:BrnA antitoxin family protein [bacterium]
MRDEYDFTNANKNPYEKKHKQQITINLDVETVDYFKKMSAETNIPYQTLINICLKEYRDKQKKINISFD